MDMQLPEGSYVKEDAPPEEAYVTRRQQMVTSWRKDILEQDVPNSYWAGLGMTYVALCALSQIFISDIYLQVMFIAVFTIWAIIGYKVLNNRSRKIRILANMTPIFSKNNLFLQIDAANRSFDQMVAIFQDAQTTKEQQIAVVERLKAIALRIMENGNLKIENAIAAGYPEYPQIDRTELPGSDHDFISMHLMSLEGVISELNSFREKDVILGEVVAQAAGAMIPPLRSIESELS